MDKETKPGSGTPEVKNTAPANDYNPIASPVVSRGYEGINLHPDDVVDRVPTPNFNPPVSRIEDVEKEASAPGNTEKQQSQSSNTEQNTFNPHYTELPNKEKEMGAEKMAEVILHGYAMLKSGSAKLAKIEGRKLNKEVKKGTVDLSVNIPYNKSGDTISVKDFVKDFDETLDDVISLSEDFKENVKPPLKRVIMKKGGAMTDEHLLAYYFSVDILQTGWQVINLMQQRNEVIEVLRDYTEKQRPLASSPVHQASSALKQEPIIKEQPAPPSPGEPTVKKPESSVKKNEKATDNGDDIKQHPSTKEVLSTKSPDSSGMISKKQLPTVGDKAVLDQLNKDFPQDVPGNKTKPGKPSGSGQTIKKK